MPRERSGFLDGTFCFGKLDDFLGGLRAFCLHLGRPWIMKKWLRAMSSAGKDCRSHLCRGGGIWTELFRCGLSQDFFLTSDEIVC